jgi:DNA-directed RNA polymerase
LSATQSGPERDADLEELMLEMGRSRYRNRVARSSIKGRRSDTRSGRLMLREAIVKLEVALKAYRKGAAQRAGAGHSSAALLKGLRSDVVALLVARVVVDAIALQMPLTATANAVGKALEEELRMRAVKAAARGVLKEAKGKTGKTSLWADLRRRLKRTARGGPARKRAIVNQVAGKVEAQIPTTWPRRERLRLGVTMVELLRVHTGLIEIRTIPRDGRRPHAVVVATPAALNWMEQQDARNECMTPVYLPMRTRPADWRDAWSGGYRLQALARTPIVKSRHRSTVDAVDKANPVIVYRATSTVQRTPWRVNRGVLAVASRLWDAGAPIAGFMERIDDPKPTPPTDERDMVGWERYTRESADWRRLYHQNKGRRVLASKTMHLAQMHKDVGEFYYPHQADFRGRLYPTPFFLQPQGDDLARGLIEFAKGAPIRDKEQADYFRGAGAGLFGVNRVATSQKVAWAHKESDRILATAADPLGFLWWADAESPFQFLAWVLDYAEWIRRPAQHASHFRVSLDASNNGLQLYSLLTRDEVGAASTNVLPSNEPRDLYQDVADRATDRLMSDPDPMSGQWLEFLGGRIPRAYTKRPTMTLPYGSTFHSAINYTRDQYEADRVAKDGTPFEILGGGGYRACSFLARHIWDAIGETVGPARAAMGWMRTVAAVCTEAGVPVVWTAPSGWPVRQAYTKYESRRIQTAVGDSIRFIRYRESKDELALKQQENGLPPNFVHSMDAAVLAFAVCRARERGVDNFAIVHDSFGVLAADAPTMLRTLRDVVADVFAVDRLKDFRDEVQRQLPEGIVLPDLPKYGSLDVEVARGAQYLFS